MHETVFQRCNLTLSVSVALKFRKIYFFTYKYVSLEVLLYATLKRPSR